MKAWSVLWEIRSIQVAYNANDEHTPNRMLALCCPTKDIWQHLQFSRGKLLFAWPVSPFPLPLFSPEVGPRERNESGRRVVCPRSDRGCPRRRRVPTVDPLPSLLTTALPPPALRLPGLLGECETLLPLVVSLHVKITMKQPDCMNVHDPICNPHKGPNLDYLTIPK